MEVGTYGILFLYGHPSSCSLMNGALNSLSLASESNTVWSQRFGSFSLENVDPKPSAQDDLPQFRKMSLG